MEKKNTAVVWGNHNVGNPRLITLVLLSTWWVSTIRAWSAVGYWRWENHNVGNPRLITLIYFLRDECRLSEFDRPWVIDDEKTTTSVTHVYFLRNECRLSELDWRWNINDEKTTTSVTFGLSHSYTLSVMSVDYRHLICRVLLTMWKLDPSINNRRTW